MNPQSRGGSARRLFARAEQLLRARLGSIEVAATRGPRDAERLAREGVRAGFRKIVVVGGDGTASEVAAGVLSAGLGDAVQIGFLPLGTGGDFARSLGLPASLVACVEKLAEGPVRRIDAGRVSCVGRGGEAVQTFFLNVVSCGLSGVVDERVNRSSKRGGGFAFLWQTLGALAAYTYPPARLRVDGEFFWEGPLLVAAAANGTSFGGGMQIAPNARCNDGWLDMVAVRRVPPLRVLWKLFSVYRGAHLDSPEVVLRRGRRLEVDPVDPSQCLWVDVDGDCLGIAPAAFEILPGALSVFGAGDGSEPV